MAYSLWLLGLGGIGSCFGPLSALVGSSSEPARACRYAAYVFLRRANFNTTGAGLVVAARPSVPAWRARRERRGKDDLDANESCEPALDMCWCAGESRSVI